jgi:transposase
MGKPYSQDLRSRVIAAVENGVTRHQAAARFGVSISSAIKWTQRFRQTGATAAKPMGGDHRSRLTGEREWLLARVAQVPDLTLAEIRQELAERGVGVGYGTVWRFFAKEKVSFKKNSHRRRAGPAARGSRA